jgi:ankyrin repeat protein
LYDAWAAGRHDIITLLVEYGADINRAFEGPTLLVAATMSRDFDTVRLALSLGADPNLECPLFTAFATGRHDIMRLLVDHGADVDYIEEGQTLLGLALKYEDLEEVRFVLSLGADPNVIDPMWEMLESCVVQGCNGCVHEDLALLLMEQDVTLLTRSRYGWALLHYAADGARTRLLRAAIDRITSPLVLDGQNDFGRTALHYAAGTLGKVPLQQTLEVVSMLLEAGADINAQDVRGATALTIATEKGSVELVQLIQDAGARRTGKRRYQALPNVDTTRS